MHPVMNNTKWEELRAAMLELGMPSPKWRTRIIGSGVESGWDSEWFYHFKEGGYTDLGEFSTNHVIREESDRRSQGLSRTCPREKGLASSFTQQAQDSCQVADHTEISLRQCVRPFRVCPRFLQAAV